MDKTLVCDHFHVVLFKLEKIVLTLTFVDETFVSVHSNESSSLVPSRSTVPKCSALNEIVMCDYSRDNFRSAPLTRTVCLLICTRYFQI